MNRFGGNRDSETLCPNHPGQTPESVQLIKLNIYYNNVGGFLSKNNIIKNSNIAMTHDILIFQETNIKDDHLGMGYDDFAICNKVASNLSLADNKTFSRGTIIAWNPEICSVKLIKEHCSKNFEIKVVQVESGLDFFHIVSAYCSPSQNRDRYSQFFITLADTISSIHGKILALGDWNVERNRSLHHPNGEQMLLNLVEFTGVTSEVSGVTRPSSGNQLDYVYSNIEGISANIKDGFSDHKGIDIEMDVRVRTFTVPARAIKRTKSIPKEVLDELVEWHVPDLIKEGVPVGNALMEMEILLWELRENLYKYRIIPEHTRVADCSRQVSMTILNSDLSTREKREKLRVQQSLDASRRITKSLTTGKGGERIMACFTLGAKKKQLVKCKLSPEDFKNDILADENETNHQNHNPPLGACSHLARPLLGSDLDKAVKKVKKKWLDHGGFSTSFWLGIGSKMMSEEDKGVYSFSNVEPVEKDRSKPDEKKGWRLVWKATSLVEKIYDCLRSMLIDSSALNNDAYCAFRSTQRTLAKVSCWTVTKESALLGCDFANAFGNACRSCANQLLGFEFLNPKINFEVTTEIGSSNPAISTMGTGAGRATGGPGFNVLFHHHFTTHSATKEIQDWVAPFADDSQIKVKLIAAAILALIKAFEEANSLGLKVHRRGAKGPALLVHKGMVEEAGRMLSEGEVEDVNVVESVKFLGVDIHICTKNNIMVGRFPIKVTRKLNFLVIELGRNIKLAKYTCNTREKLNDVFNSASNSIASTVESRMQYALCFLDRGSVYQAMQIHRRALCALAGKSPRFFGFRNFNQKLLSDTDAVTDLYGFINEISSTTYLKLCKVLGRPSMLQMALRAVNVVDEQANFANLEAVNAAVATSRKKTPIFITKINNFMKQCEYDQVTNIKPKLNDYHQAYLEMETVTKRNNFIKASTDTLLLDHLSSKGWESEIKECRLNGCEGHKETLKHVYNHHLDKINLGTGEEIDFKKAVRNENKGGRICLKLMSASVKRLANCFGDVASPALKAKKKQRTA